MSGFTGQSSAGDLMSLVNFVQSPESHQHLAELSKAAKIHEQHKRDADAAQAELEKKERRLIELQTAHDQKIDKDNKARAAADRRMAEREGDVAAKSAQVQELQRQAMTHTEQAKQRLAAIEAREQEVDRAHAAINAERKTLNLEKANLERRRLALDKAMRE